MSASNPSDRRPVVRESSRGAQVASLLALVVCLVLAFREIAAFSPIAAINANLGDPLEGQLFVPNQKPHLLIFGLSLVFLAQRARLLWRLVGSPATAWSAPLLVAALALNVWSHLVGAPFLGLVALSASLIGVAGLVAGSQGARAMRLPALFLLLALPIPGYVLNGLIDPMQLMTARATGWLLTALGIEHQVSGDLIHTRSHVFQVIEGCSGLRSMETLLMAAIVYQHWLPHSRAVSWLVVLGAPVIGLIVNQLRVLWIVLSPGSSVANSHTTQGLVMIVVGVLLIDRLNAFLVARLPREVASDPDVHDADRHPDWPFRRLAAAGVASLLCAGATLAEPWEPERPLHRNPSRYPGRIAGWEVDVDSIDHEFFGSTRHTQAVLRTYRRGKEAVSVFVAADARKEPLVSGLSPKNERLKPGREVLARWRVENGEGDGAEASIQRSREGLEYVVSWQQGVAGPLSELLRTVLVLDRSPLQRTWDAMVFRIATPIPDAHATSREAAEARLQPFVELARELFPTR
ncbi:MAG: archaeosortase/exosortase family protein [Spirochaetaceae bacterium]|nr:archaeosortase/exosortase family protein [Spirochaetaceae bacterium]